ncbi:RNA exonuclease 5 [Tribolium madens]|uniref:RNA exonuclease 5 n=1 Tax=Tribolium madens TaxID=41895 RepID=UPI001CF74516|nr:RNA exonuclease 5 [Tribolium madens]XP_044269440.1 RNA exonuclease 5 [Tribolium madens]
MKSKSTKRIENKKKKMAALIEISRLNEYDRNLKKTQISEANGSNCSELEPSVKKPRTEAPIGDSIDQKVCVPELGPSGKPKLSGLELQELKKMLREKTTKMRQQPVFKLRDVGINASLATDLENRVPLFLADLQHLIMYSQLGHHSPYSPARWCALEKFNRLATTCVLVVENMTLYHYMAHGNMFPFVSSTFEHKLEILAPNSSNSDVVRELSMVPLTGTQVKKFCTQYGTLEEAVHKSSEVFDTVRSLFPIEKDKEGKNQLYPDLPPTDRFPRTQLLLSGWQMVEENFPLPIKGLMENKYAGYVLTKDRYEDVTPHSKMFGIDCEMCKTTIGDLELTRVSVVDEDLNTFYDTLVKPENRITDYLTRFSGITYKMMKNITTRLQDVQEDLRRILPADAILVGQSLGNDLHALKMMHPYVIDTSVIYNITGDRVRKTKLKTLTEEFLSERIQEGKGGHCSTEDSMASLKLAQLKLTKSLYFGDAVMGNLHSEIRTCPELGTYNYATSMLKQTTKVDKTAVVVGLNEITSKYKYCVDKELKVQQQNEKIKYFSEKNCKEVVKKMCDSMGMFSLNIGHVKLQEGQLEGTKVFKNVDKWVKEIYENISTPGLVIVLFSGVERSNGCCFIQLKRDV